MQKPNEAQSIYANLKMMQPIFHYIREHLVQSEFNDFQLVSDLDGIRIGIQSSINKMEEIMLKSQEPKRVCY